MASTSPAGKARCVSPPCSAVTGKVIAAQRDGIDIACGEGTLRITALQRAGGKRIAAADYLNARPELRSAR